MKTITNRNYGVLWEVHLLNHCQLHVKVPGWSLVLQSVTDGSQMLQPAVLADVWWDYSMCICVHMSNSSPIWFCSFEVPVWKYYGRENVTLEIALLSYCTSAWCALLSTTVWQDVIFEMQPYTTTGFLSCMKIIIPWPPAQLMKPSIDWNTSCTVVVTVSVTSRPAFLMENITVNSRTWLYLPP